MFQFHLIYIVLMIPIDKIHLCIFWLRFFEKLHQYKEDLLDVYKRQDYVYVGETIRALIIDDSDLESYHLKLSICLLYTSFRRGKY